jgi:hypothetical protein
MGLSISLNERTFYRFREHWLSIQTFVLIEGHATTSRLLQKTKKTFICVFLEA